MSRRLDSSSFTDKILAASSLASEGSEGEIEFAFTDRGLADKSMKTKLLKYSEEHSREGFSFDDYLNINSRFKSSSSNRYSLLAGSSLKPLEERVRSFLTFLSTIGTLEELIQYVLIRIAPKHTQIFYTQSEEAKDMDPLIKEKLRQFESKWAELPEFGKQLLTIAFLIENDNSYEIDVEKAEGPLKGKELQAKEMIDLAFQSRLRLVRNFSQ